MFWSKKKKNTNRHVQADKNSTAGQEKEKGKVVGTSNSQRLREEALANARKAREVMGEETIQRIAAAIRKKENSATEQAKAQIAKADPDKVLDELMWMLKNKD